MQDFIPLVDDIMENLEQLKDINIEILTNFNDQYKILEQMIMNLEEQLYSYKKKRKFDL